MLRLTQKTLIGGCAALAFSVLSAAEPESTATSAAVCDDFESATAGAMPAGWTGDGVVTNAAYTHVSEAGLPLGDDVSGHAQFLNVTGTVVRTYGEAVSGAVVVVDMMVKVTAAEEDPLSAPANAGATQIAVAVGRAESVDGQAQAPFFVWCQADGECAWRKLGFAAPVGAWVRTTLVLDYASRKCRVGIDGDVCGVYDFPGTPATAQTVASVTVAGATSVDDVVVTPNKALAEIKPYGENAAFAVGEAESAVKVPLNWCLRNSVGRDTLAQTVGDGSGLNYAQKYEAGLGVESGYAVDDGTKFAVSRMTLAEESASFTVPGKAASYAIVVTDENGKNVSLTPETVSATADGKTLTTAKVDLSQAKLGEVAGKVLTFQVVAKAEDSGRGRGK